MLPSETDTDGLRRSSTHLRYGGLAADPAADGGRVRSALGIVATATLSAIGTEAGRHVLELVQQALQALGAEKSGAPVPALSLSLSPSRPLPRAVVRLRA